MFCIIPGGLYTPRHGIAVVVFNEKDELTETLDVNPGTVLLALSEPRYARWDVTFDDQLQQVWSCKFLMADKTVELYFMGLQMPKEYLDLARVHLAALEEPL